ncbi:hypothetical protein [Hyphomicrobium sulfonivorans]|uniref:hypothetical protein n=1 Tax=Hyphomicrobium sulfonivorans TaxID=121290 RepID=UPI00156D5206|nr:hypothetical protein [Hyphomicrobium sulfonivorans]MBI1651390.1 hypothetical protein [Hyphomicrobium sulfonivorans]NSL73222.1 hypothetical protein [Hyphomicrobium sulfonivorans]
MAQHLPGKVARLISDFLTIGELTTLIEHEMEKRIVARHGLVKLDALLTLVARLKNSIRDALPPTQKKEIGRLEDLIARLRKDLEKSDMATGRDALAAHALHLDLMRIVDAWKCMGETTYAVLASDLKEIDAELLRIANSYPAALAYPGAFTFSVEQTWQEVWRNDTYLGDPNRPRLANIYPGIGTAGIVASLPGGHPAQDVTIRATGIATFLRQVRIMLQAVSRGCEVERLFAEMMLNDYCALWELLFVSGVQNEHGKVDLCVLDHWTSDGWCGASCLAALKNNPHPDLGAWQQTRNKVTAHVDADADIWRADLKHWPMTVDTLIDEALRVIEAMRDCASLDIRSKFFFIPPTQLTGEVVGLSNQAGRYWKDG